MVENFKPETILVFKGMEIFPETLLHFKNKNIKLVNYNPDNPFIFTGKGSGNSNITSSIKLFDLYITYDNDIQMRLFEIGVNSAILPFGYELPIEDFEQSQKVSEIKKICFIGNPDPDRANFIRNLSEGFTNYNMEIIGTNFLPKIQLSLLNQLFIILNSGKQFENTEFRSI